MPEGCVQQRVAGEYFLAPRHSVLPSAQREKKIKEESSSKKKKKKDTITLGFFLAENFRGMGMIRIILAIYSVTTRSVPLFSLPSLEDFPMMQKCGIEKDHNTPLYRVPKTEKGTLHH